MSLWVEVTTQKELNDAVKKGKWIRRVAECAKALGDFDCPRPEHHSTHVEPIPCGECANCELAAALVDLEEVR
jgi:hypothetical protein